MVDALSRRNHRHHVAFLLNPHVEDVRSVVGKHPGDCRIEFFPCSDHLCINAIGLCNIIKGQKVSTVIEKLSNVPCASRGTSCPDQLAKILKSLK